MRLLEEIGEYLASQLSWLHPQENFWYGDVVPDGVETTTVSIFEYPGKQPMRTFGNPRAVWIYPRIQVLTRDRQYEKSNDASWEIFHVLDGVVEQAIPKYHKISGISNPYELGPDDAGRVRMICNYEVERDYP